MTCGVCAAYTEEEQEAIDFAGRHHLSELAWIRAREADGDPIAPLADIPVYVQQLDARSDL